MCVIIYWYIHEWETDKNDNLYVVPSLIIIISYF
jgi:hypothetical protein